MEIPAPSNWQDSATKDTPENMVENMVENMKTWLRGNSTHGQISLHVVETGDTQEIHRRYTGETWEIHGRYMGDT